VVRNTVLGLLFARLVFRILRGSPPRLEIVGTFPPSNRGLEYIHSRVKFFLETLMGRTYAGNALAPIVGIEAV
jgi:hypothetical protein